MPRSRLLIAAAALILAVGLGGYVAYDQVLSGDSVAPLALPTTSPDVAATDLPRVPTPTPASRLLASMGTSLAPGR